MFQVFQGTQWLAETLETSAPLTPSPHPPSRCREKAHQKLAGSNCLWIYLSQGQSLTVEGHFLQLTSASP